MIIIKPTKWADVEPGSMILGTDATLREIGDKEAARSLDGLTFRKLGTTGGANNNGRASCRPDTMVLAIALDADDPRLNTPTEVVAMLFMRAGFTVELLPL